MKQETRLVIVFFIAVICSSAQFYWIKIIPSISHLAAIESCACAIVGALIIWFGGRVFCGAGVYLRIALFLLVMMATSLLVMVVYSLFNRPDGLFNSFSQHPVHFVLTNAVGLLGWLVGLGYAGAGEFLKGKSVK